MQTRIAVDATLLQKAAASTGLASNRALVEHAIRLLLESAPREARDNSWQPTLLADREAPSAA